MVTESSSAGDPHIGVIQPPSASVPLDAWAESKRFFVELWSFVVHMIGENPPCLSNFGRIHGK